MKYGVSVAVLLLVFSIQGRADSFLPQVAPIRDIGFPLGVENQIIGSAPPMAEYPLIKSTPTSYLILYGTGSNLTVGRIPKYDPQRNLTGLEQANRLAIKSGARTQPVFQGYIPFDANRSYEVIGETESSYQVRFRRENYSVVCELSKTSVVLLAETELRPKQEGAKADSILPEVSPLNDIRIPLGRIREPIRAVPTAEYPLIKVLPNSYLILCGAGTNRTVGLIPKENQIRASTADINGRSIQIRSTIITFIYDGYIPFDYNKRYEVVGETDAEYKVRFSHADFSKICELSKTSVVYFSETLVRIERGQKSRQLYTQDYWNSGHAESPVAQKNWLEALEYAQRTQAEEAARQLKQREEQARLEKKRQAEEAEREIKRRAEVAEQERIRQAELAEQERIRQAEEAEHERLLQLGEKEQLEKLRLEVLQPSGMSAVEFRSQRPMTPVIFRTMARIDNYYSYNLGVATNLDNFWSVRLTTLDGDGIGNGYIEKKGRGESLFALLKDNQWHSIFVRIAYPPLVEDPGAFIILNYQHATASDNKD